MAYSRQLDYQMKLYFSVQRKWQNKSGCFKKEAILHSLPESRWPSWERGTGWRDLFQVISPFKVLLLENLLL